MANLEALDIALTPEHIKYLESILPFDPGFPITMIVCNIQLHARHYTHSTTRAMALDTLLFSRRLGK